MPTVFNDWHSRPTLRGAVWNVGSWNGETMTKYRFIRTGNKPVEQVVKYDSEDDTSATQALRNCFEFCKPHIKQELEKFISSPQCKSIEFKFDKDIVMIERL